MSIEWWFENLCKAEKNCRKEVINFTHRWERPKLSCLQTISKGNKNLVHCGFWKCQLSHLLLKNFHDMVTLWMKNIKIGLKECVCHLLEGNMVCPGRPDLQTDELLLWASREQESHACKHHGFRVLI